MKTLLRSATLLCACITGMEHAALTITGGNVDTSATATSGRQGSSSGVIQDNPAATAVFAGLDNVSGAQAIAGPVAPGQIVTLPGTTGVATGSATASVDATDPKLLGIDLLASNSFANLDGGIYQGFGSASFLVEFAVAAPTDYTLTGTFNIDPGDLLWAIQLSDGPNGFLVNNATEPLDTGSFQ